MWEDDRPIHAQPPVPAMDGISEIEERCGGRTVALLLDFDGTLSPIVPHPDQAGLASGMRDELAAWVRRCPVAVVSGRDMDDVAERVHVDGIEVMGDHGFVFLVDGEERLAPLVQPTHLDSLASVARRLEGSIGAIAGAWVEKKRCTLAVHTRQVARGQRADVERLVDAAMRGEGALRKTHGKEVFEVQPDVDWDKGEAVRSLLARWKRRHGELFAVAMGDDVTDEHAFRAVRGEAGIGVLVGDARPSAAEYRLRDPGEVLSFLRALRQACT